MIVLLLPIMLMFSALPVEAISYKQLKYSYMKAQGIEHENEGSQDAQELSSEANEPDFNIPSFSDAQKTLKIHDILATLPYDCLTDPEQTEQQAEMFNLLARDLELYSGEGKHPDVSLAALIDRTVSASGATVLRKMLAHPVACFNESRFIRRQTLIKQLVENQQLFDAVDGLCGSWAKNENRMLSNWHKPDTASEDVFKKFCYFSMSPCKEWNKSSSLMGGSAALTYGSLGLAGALDIVFLSIQYKIDPQFKFLVDNFGLIIKHADAKALVVISAGASLFAALKIYGLHSLYKQGSLIKNGINFLQGRLIGIGSAVRLLHEVDALDQMYPVIGQGLVSWGHIYPILYNEKNDEFGYLVNLLQKDTFAGEPSFFSLSGRVLAAHKLMEIHKDKFAGAIELIGELDACLSTAKLIKQFQERRVAFCFAELHKSDQPYIKLKNFWNPFVNYKHVVPNDIELGGRKSEQSVLLTGSNTGGKSTIGLKGTLISLYLSHTLGISPADSCEASYFGDFCSYIHVLDDVASGESSFQAEVNRANKLLKMVAQLPQDRFAFIVIDELFKGTSPDKGAPGAHKVIKHLAQFDNVQFIAATHFKELTSLEEETQGRCVNMKIDVHESEQGDLIRPYKLEYGISDSNIADNLLQAHFEEIQFAI